MARNAGQICYYYLQGHCRFGDNCWNEHPQYQADRSSSGSNRRGAWSGHNQRYSNPVQTSSFSKSSHWHNNRDSRSLGFSQNRYAALNSNENVGNNGVIDEEENLLEIIMKDMEIWESSGQWMFSTYSPVKEKPNISGFPDFLPEELRLEYYNCRANNNIQSYISSVQQLITQWRSRLLELKNINASTKTALMILPFALKIQSNRYLNLRMWLVSHHLHLGLEDNRHQLLEHQLFL
ncbi:nucleoporin NUP42 isoform X2 [Rhineura floridana]|uniref:nucleoporin NUP42 isoform X2 n=1 Tax=Rhineura floridana TaxID=261503 RepID=UPI002AC7F2BE|nr:nucleoporin NUP42 isoform X2 [Rhineura floridana]